MAWPIGPAYRCSSSGDLRLIFQRCKNRAHSILTMVRMSTPRPEGIGERDDHCNSCPGCGAITGVQPKPAQPRCEHGLHRVQPGLDDHTSHPAARCFSPAVSLVLFGVIKWPRSIQVIIRFASSSGGLSDYLVDLA